jgi:4Fe-4S single cluster domain of Ferredoxin I
MLGCIDCDVCRWMCPTIYARKGIKAAVISQPVKEVYSLPLTVHVLNVRNVLNALKALDLPNDLNGLIGCYMTL